MDHVVVVELPLDVLVEIAMTAWWAYGNLRVCNKTLYDALSKVDPYAEFTRPCTARILPMFNVDKSVSYKTFDGVEIKRVNDGVLGRVSVSWRDGRNIGYEERILYKNLIVNGSVSHPDCTYIKETYTNYNGALSVRDRMGTIHYNIVSKEEYDEFVAKHGLRGKE